MKCIFRHDYVANLNIIAVLLQHLLHCNTRHRFLKAARDQTFARTKDNLNVINQLPNSPSEGITCRLTQEMGVCHKIVAIRFCVPSLPFSRCLIIEIEL